MPNDTVTKKNLDTLVGAWEYHAYTDSSEFVIVNHFGPVGFYYFDSDTSLHYFNRAPLADNIEYEEFTSWQSYDTMFVKFDDTVTKWTLFEIYSDTLVLTIPDTSRPPFFQDRLIYVKKDFHFDSLTSIINKTFEK